MSRRLCFLVVALLSSSVFAIDPFLIRGRETKSTEFEEIVKIENSTGHCTATIVGKETLITAAHCGKNKEKIYFEYKSKAYRGTLYKDTSDTLDLALVVTSSELPVTKPVEIGGIAKTGQTISMLGYGCSKPQTQQEDEDELKFFFPQEEENYALRYGKATIRKISGSEMFTYSTSEAAGCSGDSGGPALLESKGKSPQLLGVLSKADLSSATQIVRLDWSDSKKLIKTLATDNGVDVCGVTKTCTKK